MIRKIAKYTASLLISLSTLGTMLPVSAKSVSDSREITDEKINIGLPTNINEYHSWWNNASATKKIVDAHRNDFDYYTVESYLKKKGGYKAYVRSLGGVFAKYVDYKGPVKNAQEFYELAQYVWGLYDIWGIDYSNGCESDADWNNNKYRAHAGGGGRFYPSSSPFERYYYNYSGFGFRNGSDLPDIDTMLANPKKYYVITNCSQGVLQLLKKAGLVNGNQQSPGYNIADWASSGYHVKVISDASKLQPGDVLIYSNGSNGGHLNNKYSVSNWKYGTEHENIVVARDDAKNTITFADSGHGYTYDGNGFYTTNIGEWPYQYAKDWIAYRIEEVAERTIYGGKWKQDSVGWWFQYHDGTYPKSTWEKICGEWYYFNAKGYIETGVKKINGYYYGLTEYGIHKGWTQIGGKWYYFVPEKKGDFPEGAALQGWWKLDWTGGKNWFYFDDTGKMLTGIQKIINKYYYLGSDGAMVTGWKLVKNKWYYFYPSTSGNAVEGAAAIGWQNLTYKGTKNRYYFNSKGEMQTGWLELNNTWYYFEPSGAMVSGKKTINGKTYNFGSDGKLYCLKIIYKVNKGRLLAKHGKDVSTFGRTVVINGKTEHVVAYNGGTLDANGLTDYNNPKFLNITRKGYIAKKGAEWNTKPDGTGKSYSQDKIYKASDFADISKGSKTITLYVNWVKTK